jgi:hypothetical protein
MKAIPILELHDGAEIRALYHDQERGVLLAGISDGRIIKISSLASTAYLTGNRSLLAEVKDGFGNASDAGWSNLFYGLRNRIIEASEDKAPVRWKSVEKPFSADSVPKVMAVFTSPPMDAGEDFMRWNTLDWDQSVASGTGIKVGARVAETEGGLASVPWTMFESSSSGSISDSLDGFNHKGSFIQLRVEMTTEASGQTPEVARLVASYTTKFAVYFFTTKFSLEKGTNIGEGLLTASMSVPTNTEVKFGVTGTNSSDWTDYFEITPDELFAFPEEMDDKLKVGIKLISYSELAAPVVDEFAISFGGDKKNLLNEQE